MRVTRVLSATQYWEGLNLYLVRQSVVLHRFGKISTWDLGFCGILLGISENFWDYLGFFFWIFPKGVRDFFRLIYPLEFFVTADGELMDGLSHT